MRMLFMGRKPAGARALEWSIRSGFHVVGAITECCEPDAPVREAAARLHIRMYDYEEASEAIVAGNLMFDVGVSFVYSRYIKDPLLSHPPYRILNFHPAPLPDYKGTAGYNIAILESLKRWAVTAHYVDAGIDTGPIIEHFEFDIDPKIETAQTLEKKSQTNLFELYKSVLSQLAEKKILESYPNVGGRYVSRQEMEEMKEIKQKDDVDRKIRAFWYPPHTGACITINGKRYTLLNEDILKEVGQLYNDAKS